MQQIMSAIERGQLRRGDRLPAERELAETFNVSRQMVREAIGALIALGILEAHHGGGTFIRRESVSNLESNLSALLEDKKESVYQLLEVRREMEGRCAYLAAENADDNDLQNLETIIGEMEERLAGNDQEGERVDMEFHLAVAQATHNEIRAQIYNSIFHLLREVHHLAREKIYEANQEKLLAQHQAIYEAIKARDANAAQNMMLDHLNFVEEELRKLDRNPQASLWQEGIPEVEEGGVG